MPTRIHRRRDADPANKTYPIDTPGRIKAAWAYIHQPRNGSKYTRAEAAGRITRCAGSW